MVAFLGSDQCESGAIKAMSLMNSDISICHVLPAIQVPTLVLNRTGDEDVPIESMRWAADRIPGASFGELDGIDHGWWVNSGRSSRISRKHAGLQTTIPVTWSLTSATATASQDPTWPNPSQPCLIIRLCTPEPTESLRRETKHCGGSACVLLDLPQYST